MKNHSSHEYDHGGELPTAEKLFKQAGELTVLYGKIEEYEENGDKEGFHRSFVLGEDAVSKDILHGHGIKSINFVPSYLADRIPTRSLLVFRFLPEEGVTKDIDIYEDGVVIISQYPDEDELAMPNNVSELFENIENDETIRRAIENMFGPEGRKYFDEKTAEKEAWIHLTLSQKDELSTEDALKLEHVLDDVGRELKY